MSQKKQLQRLKLAEDERKLQTKRFVKQCVWKSKDGNHRLMKSGKKAEVVSTEKSGLFCFIQPLTAWGSILRLILMPFIMFPIISFSWRRMKIVFIRYLLDISLFFWYVVLEKIRKREFPNHV